MIFKPKRQTQKLAKPPKGKFFFANQEFDRKIWYKNARLLKLYFYCMVLVLTNVANGFDGSMMNGLQSLPYWQEYFNYPRGSILGLFAASMSLGSIIGLPLVPPMVDHLGRKSGVVFGSLVVLLGVGLQSGAVGFKMFLASRFVLGFGMVFACGAAPLLVSEISHPQDRAVICTFLGCAYGIGSFIASWVTFGTLKISSDWAWRLPSLLQCSCTIVILILIWFIPESPRYYINRDQPDKALKVLAYYHADGDENDSFVQLEFAEISTALAMDKQFDTNSRYSDFVKTPGNRKRLFILCAMALFGQWSGNGLVSYYLTLVMESIGITLPEEQLGINGGLKSFGLCVTVGIVWFVDSLGRRPIFLTSTGGMLATFTIWTILSARYAIEEEAGHVQEGLGRGVIVMIFSYDFFYNFRSGVLATYMVEILPYGLRAKGATIANFVTLVAVFFNQYVNSIALEALQWRYYIFYSCFLVLEIFVVYFFIVETRYTPIEEVSKYFDGDQADVVEITHAQREKSGMETGMAKVEEVPTVVMEEKKA